MGKTQQLRLTEQQLDLFVAYLPGQEPDPLAEVRAAVNPFTDFAVVMASGCTSEVFGRAVEIVAENAGRRYEAGQDYEAAKAGALAEFAERWPGIASLVARRLAR